MELKEFKEIESQIRKNQESLLSSFVAENKFMYSNIFNNCGQKILGQAMFDCIKDLVEISKLSWKLDRDDFYGWINEAFDELEEKGNE